MMTQRDAGLILRFVNNYVAENYEGPTQRELQNYLEMSNFRVNMAIRLLREADACRFSKRSGQIIGFLNNDSLETALMRVQRQVELKQLKEDYELKPIPKP